MTASSGESTSARLRRVEQERDELRAEVERLVDLCGKAMREWREALAGRLAAQAEMDERHAERDAARAALKTVGEQRDLARAELASARTEIEQLRDRRYANQLCPRCGDELEDQVAAEQASQSANTEGAPTA